jgi:hypothetical protein
MALNRIARQRIGFAKAKYELALLRIVRRECIAQSPVAE